MFCLDSMVCCICGLFWEDIFARWPFIDDPTTHVSISTRQRNMLSLSAAPYYLPFLHSSLKAKGQKMKQRKAASLNARTDTFSCGSFLRFFCLLPSSSFYPYLSWPRSSWHSIRTGTVHNVHHISLLSMFNVLPAWYGVWTLFPMLNVRAMRFCSIPGSVLLQISLFLTEFSVNSLKLGTPQQVQSI